MTGDGAPLGAWEPPGGWGTGESYLAATVANGPAAAVAVAEPAVPPGPALELGQVVEAFRRWLYLPDARPLLAVLGAVAANRLDGDPVWLLLVGPPGGGKSEILQSLGGLENVHPAATLTEPALLSGTPAKERENGAKGGLLRQIGDYGIVVCKDFGSVLSMHRDARAQVLAALREVYDGSWTRHVGTGGGQTLHWQGKVGLVAGCTPTIDRHHAVMGAMGERFVLLRLPEVDSGEQARRALAHAGKERAMRAELSAAVRALLAGTPQLPRPLEGAEQERLIRLAELVVRARSAVERDSYSREVDLIPEPEAPTRLVVMLERLLAGLDAIGADRAEAWGVVGRVALDSIPALRLAVLRVLLAAREPLATSAVAEAVRYPTTTTGRALEDLCAHALIQRHAGGSGKANQWELEPWTESRLADALTSPVLSSYVLSTKDKSRSSDKTGELGEASL